MNKRLITAVLSISLVGLSATAQQNITIRPGDDAVAMVLSVVDPDSTITFEAGYYKVAPKGYSGAEGRPDFIRMPPGTTIRGAGSGLDPTRGTIIDCGYAYDSAIKIDDNIDGVVVENITFMNCIDTVLEFDTGSFENTFNNVWAIKSHESCVDMNGSAEAEFNFCVFGWSGADAVNLNDTSFGVFRNCDIFLGTSDIVEAAGASEAVLLNCIIYAGPGSNDIESSGGFITVANSVGWDPVDSDPPGVTLNLMGRIDLNGAGLFIDLDNNVGEDPLYVAPPGMGFTAETMDLRLQEGSPALTAGSTSHNADYEPTGTPTFAGSQGLADTTHVKTWSLF